MVLLWEQNKRATTAVERRGNVSADCFFGEANSRDLMTESRPEAKGGVQGLAMKLRWLCCIYIDICTSRGKFIVKHGVINY